MLPTSSFHKCLDVRGGLILSVLCAGHVGGAARAMRSFGAYVTVLGQATSSRIACQVRDNCRRVLSPTTQKFERFLDYEDQTR